MILPSTESSQYWISDGEDFSVSALRARTAQVGSKYPEKSIHVILYLVILPLLITACSASLPHTGNESMDVHVKSWELLDISPLNSTIEEAVAAGKTWPSSPTLIVFELLGGDVDTRVFSLTQKANRIEVPDRIVVVLIRDGFIDDSVRGDWHQLVFYLMPDRTWRVGEVRRARRCWRIDTGSYQSDPCP